jgi:cyclic dehypoxanthinyl futalosine synthase
MNTADLLQRALQFDFLNMEEGVFLYHNASTPELMYVANELRKIQVPHGKVTWQIDRNVNTTNVCIANCKFCNFFRRPGHEDSYITDIETYKQKIEETFRLGGDQLLLQGGHHPDLGLAFYTDLFKQLKELYPALKLHSLGPPEIAHVSKLEGMSHIDVLTAMKAAGLDSLPGAGAEILNDRVRRLISKGKCGGKEWLDVMRAAHKINLVWIREVQAEKPEGHYGFTAFIPWPFQDDGTLLRKVRGITNNVTGDEYIRMIALSRIMLPNVKNIQASWLTVGKQVAQLCLHAGANDFGSIMIEENVVSAAGAPHRFTAKGIQNSIAEAGFEPQLRNQRYEWRNLPEQLEEQVINY